MKKLLCLAMAVLVPLSVSAESLISAAPKSVTQAGPAYVPGEILIRPATAIIASATSNAMDTDTYLSMVNASYGATTIETIGSIRRIRLPDAVSVENGVNMYASTMGIETVEPNYYYYGSVPVVANDTLYSLLWGLHNTGQTVNGTVGTAGAHISAPWAWDLATGSASIVVAVLDSGIRWSHQDLSANIWTNSGETAANGIDDDGNGYVDDVRGWDFVNADNNPDDDNGHGTHVAGTIGAVGNNNLGVTGVNWAVQLMPVKAGNAASLYTAADIIAGINYAATNGADVVNMSFGGPSFSSLMKAAIDAAPNVLFVAAAANGGADGIGDDNDISPIYPASYTSANIISVAASDQVDSLAAFSNFGAVSVDVAAPGVNIASTFNTSDSMYAYSNGTSMAAPHVAGLGALMKGANSTLTVAQLIAEITGNVDSKPAFTGKMSSGGRINAYASVNAVIAPTAPSVLTATGASSTQVDLVWTDNATNETGFKIERKTGVGGTYSQIATTSANAVSYSDTSTSADSSYYYRVRAYHAYANSSYSTEANTATVASLSALTANASSSSQIDLSWTDNSALETGFKIERKTGVAGTFAQVATVGANATTYSNTGLSGSTTYYYRVRAYNASANSSYSAIASAATSAAPAAASGGGGGGSFGSMLIVLGLIWATSLFARRKKLVMLS